MTFSQQEELAAQILQDSAAQEISPQVRLVAGPGTGKSRTIERRVAWLLGQGNSPAQITVLSFTRASSEELEERIKAYASSKGIANAGQVRVSTLHSLALRLLKQAGMLQQYPADPLVLDNWEQKEIFDGELSHRIGSPPTRCEKIRLYHEAFWSTGQYNPTYYVVPTPPVSPAEQTEFDQFHSTATQVYSFVLPGEIIRQCVVNIQNGLIDPIQLTDMQHLIVDEFQDLNPIDQEFIRVFIDAGVVTFVAGDDDQSIYSFRFAEPSGIQNFLTTNPNAAGHSLNHCFRCTPLILDAAEDLLGHFPVQNRITKTLDSMYTTSNPQVGGQVHRHRYRNADEEAEFTAQSCQSLIQAGIRPRDIMILISNTRLLGSIISDALDNAQVPFTELKSKKYIDLPAGRFSISCLRIVCNTDDYIAHRTILGVRRGVGSNTIEEVLEKVNQNALNYKDLFYNPIPNGVFSQRAETAIKAVANIVVQLLALGPDVTLTVGAQTIGNMIQAEFGAGDKTEWDNLVGRFPGDMTLGELKSYLTAQGIVQEHNKLQEVYERLDLQPPEDMEEPDHVRLMTMHGAKGLSAKIVFVPGLEEDIFPGGYRIPYNALVLEAARLLYVSITRARIACILSMSNQRVIFGQLGPSTPSRFASHVGGAFVLRNAPLDATEVAAIITDARNYDL